MFVYLFVCLFVVFTFIILEQQGGVEAPVHVSSVLPRHVLQGRPRWPPSSLYGFTVRFTKKNIWIKYFILQSNAVSILSFLSVSSKILIRKSPIKTLYLPILQFSADTMLWIVPQFTFYWEDSLNDKKCWRDSVLGTMSSTSLSVSDTFYNSRDFFYISHSNKIQVEFPIYIFSKVSPAIFASICNQLCSPNWGSQK